MHNFQNCSYFYVKGSDISDLKQDKFDNIHSINCLFLALRAAVYVGMIIHNTHVGKLGSELIFDHLNL